MVLVSLPLMDSPGLTKPISQRRATFLVLPSEGESATTFSTLHNVELVLGGGRGGGLSSHL